MRCEPCGKFVSYDTEVEPEANLEISDEGQLTGDVRRVLQCSECSEDMKETTFDVDVDLGEIIKAPEGQADCPQKVEGSIVALSHDWDWENAEEPSVSADERMETKDKKGKPIKSSRYMTQYYGILIEGTVKCKRCSVEATYEIKDECAASSMDELM